MQIDSQVQKTIVDPCFQGLQAQEFPTFLGA